MTFGLDKMLFKSLFQFGMVGSLRHFRQGAGQLAFCVEKVLQLFDK